MLFDPPRTPNGDTALSQISQMYSYLYQMSERLNMAFSNQGTQTTLAQTETIEEQNATRTTLFDLLKESFFEYEFPVGIVVKLTVSTHPATLWGYGTWVQLKDRFLLGAGDTYSAGAQDGSATHSHKYGMIVTDYYGAVSGGADDTGPGVIDYSVAGGESTGAKTSVANRTLHHLTTTTYASSAMAVKKSEGETDSDSNMPPYEVVYFWKRTA